MLNTKLLQQIARKDSDKEKIAAQVIKRPELLVEIFAGLNADTANIRYGCDKILRMISAQAPVLLYPKFDFFADNLTGANTFFKWGAIEIIANLAAADTDNKFEKIFDRYFAAISGQVLITAANTIKAAARIAKAKPHLTERIIKELLKVEKADYQTTECNNIARGQTIKAFDEFFEQIGDKEPVVIFVRKQLKDTRNATRKAAEKFLKSKNL
jgi:hypothetical protein